MSRYPSPSTSSWNWGWPCCWASWGSWAPPTSAASQCPTRSRVHSRFLFGRASRTTGGAEDGWCADCWRRLGRDWDCGDSDVTFNKMNKYEVQEELDKGSYGVVYRARRVGAGTTVAIKEFKIMPDVDVQKIIEREARMLKRLRSKFVVELIEVYNAKGTTFFVFEFLERNLLDHLGLHKGALPESQARLLLFQLLQALQFIHGQGCVHRDLKPENVLLTKAGEAKLCDFGFCREVGQAMTDYVATRWYRSPELLIGQQYSKQVDIWALGCIFAEMVQGDPLFPGQNDLDQLRLIQEGLGPLSKKQRFYFDINPVFQGNKLAPPTQVAGLAKRFSAKLSQQGMAVLALMLKLDPTQRGSAEDLLADAYFDECRTKKERSNSKADIRSIYGYSGSGVEQPARLKQSLSKHMSKYSINGISRSEAEVSEGKTRNRSTQLQELKVSVPVKPFQMGQAEGVRLPSLHSKQALVGKDLRLDPKISIVHKIYSNRSKPKLKL